MDEVEIFRHFGTSINSVQRRLNYRTSVPRQARQPAPDTDIVYFLLSPLSLSKAIRLNILLNLERTLLP